MKLKEWKDANGNKVSLNNTSTKNTASSGDYKKRFEKLLDYHIAHRDKDVVRYKKDAQPYGFSYSERHSGGLGGYQTDIVGSFDKNGNWDFRAYMDNKELTKKKGNGWDTFVYEISFYLALPPVTTDPEYQDLLTEWVDAKGNKITLNTSATSQSTSSSNKNYPDQTDRYKRLLAQITSDKIVKYTVNLLDDRILAITLNNGVGVKIIFKPYVPCYVVQVDGYDTECDDYEEVLKTLIIEGIITDTDLCESTGSIADDFKLYENLWENI